MTMPAANLRPENIMGEGAPKVMFDASVLYSPPTLGFYWGWISYYEPDRIDRMLREVGERTAKIALTAFEIAIKAMGVHEPGPQERLALYRVKPQDLWHEQAVKFPWRFEHDMADWIKLEAEYGPPEPETLPEVTGETYIPQEPAPKKKVRRLIRDERGRADRVEEYEE